MQLQSPRGTKDILPDDQKFWTYLFDVTRKKMEAFGAKRIETPIFEYADLYIRAIGRGTDVVDKEMFEVRRASTVGQDGKDDSSDMKVLRPEYTAGIVRAYLQNGMSTWSQPVKLWYWGPAFRYERPQAGRYRIFNQLGIEVIGDEDALTDSSVIFLAWQILKEIGLEKQIIVDINSIGCTDCRAKMKKKLVEYFQNFLGELCPDCNRRYAENPLRIFDCKEASCQRIIEKAPQLIDLLCGDCSAHFKLVLENLDILEIPYNLNQRLVRGLDYYTRTVFEIYLNDDSSRQRTLIAGGRYDGLVKLYGGADTPAVGWAAGVERIVEILKDKEIDIPEEISSDVCIVQVGDKARRVALPLASKLENEKIRTTFALGKDSLKGQLRSASKLGSPYCLIIGQREVIDKTAIIRDMNGASQETIRQDKLIGVLKQKLKK